jgi:predicted transglutaminase-like cysteine proteinase
MARELADWVQSQAREHYREDGAIDRWATLGETFRNDGDDCDGLELLTFNLLRELGFADSEVYRAIVYRRSDGQHHMVTLWFEDESDPWVIDPTGAMTSGMPRMSEVAGWAPLKVFSEDEDFSVVEQAIAQNSP